MAQPLPAVILLAEANIPTEHGPFRLAVFQVAGDPAEHLAMIKGSVAGALRSPVRVHSECLTSEVMGSLKCDCRDQLSAGLAHVAKAERGMVIYLRQEGRGIGLVNKIRAYALQEHGADTIAANQMLGLEVDSRKYDAAAALLNHLGVLSIQLLTNNPDKMEQLEGLGVKSPGGSPW